MCFFWIFFFFWPLPFSCALLPRPLAGRCKTSRVRERGKDGTRTEGARTDSSGAAGSGSPSARSCDCGRSAACGRLKEQGSGSHDAASLPFFLPPSRASSLRPSLSSFYPSPASPGIRAPAGAGTALPAVLSRLGTGSFGHCSASRTFSLCFLKCKAEPIRWAARQPFNFHADFSKEPSPPSAAATLFRKEEETHLKDADTHAERDAGPTLSSASLGWFSVWGSAKSHQEPCALALCLPSPPRGLQSFHPGCDGKENVFCIVSLIQKPPHVKSLSCWPHHFRVVSLGTAARRFSVCIFIIYCKDLVCARWSPHPELLIPNG